MNNINLTPRERALVDNLQGQLDGLAQQVSALSQQCEQQAKASAELQTLLTKFATESEADTKPLQGLETAVRYLSGQLKALDPNYLKRLTELPALLDRLNKEAEQRATEHSELLQEWSNLCSMLTSLRS